MRERSGRSKQQGDIVASGSCKGAIERDEPRSVTARAQVAQPSVVASDPNHSRAKV